MGKKRRIKKEEQSQQTDQTTSKLVGAGQSLKKLFIPAIFIMALVLYGNTIGHQFAFDDSIVITSNSYTKLGIKGIPNLLTTDMFEGMYGEQLEITGGRYRPLSLVTFALEYEIAGENPALGHLTNVILYGFTGILLYLLLIQLFGPQSVVPFITTLLFIAHPIHTEVVANIKSRDEMLCLLGSLFAIYFFLKFYSSKKLWWMLLSVFSFFLALLAKETATIFLVILPLTSWYFLNVKGWKNLYTAFFPYLLVFTVYFLIRTSLVGMVGGGDSSDIMENPFIGAAIPEKYATIALILGKYIKLLFFPFPLASDYSFNQIPLVNWKNPWVILWSLFYLIVAAYAIKSLFKKDKIGYGIFIYLLPLSLTSNIVFNIGAPMGERFVYISSLGFCLVIAILLANIFKTKTIADLRSGYILPIITGIMMLIFSIQTIARNQDWYDDNTLFAKDVKTVPNSAKIHYYYGNTLLNKALLSGNPQNTIVLEQAKVAFRRSIEINPDFHWSHYNLARVYDRLNSPDSAIAHLLKTLEIQPNHIASQGLLGKIYGMSKQDYAKSIFYLRKALEYGDITKGNYHNLGIAYALSSQPEKAIENFEQALKLAPDEARIYFDIGLTYQAMNQPEKASFYRKKAYEIDPSLRN